LRYFQSKSIQNEQSLVMAFVYFPNFFDAIILKGGMITLLNYVCDICD